MVEGDANSLSTGSYNIIITDNDNCQYISNIILNSPSIISQTITSSYINECFSSIEINTIGGVSPYNYTIITPNNIYYSDINKIDLVNDGLNPYFITSSITDINGCINISYHEIYGREYQYSGSYCETV